jgi:hypothetical protein
MGRQLKMPSSSKNSIIFFCQDSWLFLRAKRRVLPSACPDGAFENGRQQCKARGCTAPRTTTRLFLPVPTHRLAGDVSLREVPHDCVRLYEATTAIEGDSWYLSLEMLQDSPFRSVLSLSATDKGHC